MENTFAILFWGVLLFLVGRWIYNSRIRGPQKDKQIGLYKFSEFKEVILDYNILPDPVAGNEYILTYRENISNGVDVIGYFLYSIHDYIVLGETSKQHNYYFTVVVVIRDTTFKQKSAGYFRNCTVEICRNEIAVLRDRVTNHESYKRLLQLNQLR